MPAAADVGRMVGILQHFRDAGLLGDPAEEPVDVDRTEALGDGKLRVWRQALVPEEHHAVVGMRVQHGFHLRIGQRVEVDSGDLGAAASVRRSDLHLQTPDRVSPGKP